MFISLIALILLIILFVQIGGLKKRLNILEEHTGIVKIPPNEVPEYELPENDSPPIAPLPPRQKNAFDEFLVWLGTDWLMKLGALLLILALGWFVTYAFMNNWIGPLGRITLGIVSGTILLAIGHLQIPKREIPGQVLVITGAAMILLTIFAARTFYDFFTPASALGFMALVVAMTTIVAVVHKARSLAIVALIGGAIIPFLTNAPNPDYAVLLGYVLILDFGMLAVVAFRGWRELTLLAFLVTAAYSSVFFRIEAQLAWFFMVIYFLVFYCASIATIWDSQKLSITDLLTTGGISLLMVGWIIGFVPKEWQSSILVLVAVLPVVFASIFHRAGAIKEVVYVHAGAGALALGVATAIELSGSALTIAFAIEATVIVALSAFALRNYRAAIVTSALQIIPLGLSLESLDQWGSGSILNEHFFVLLIVGTTFAITAWILTQTDATKSSEARTVTITHGVLAGVFLAALFWRSLEVSLPSVDTAHGIALILYTLIGTGALYYGIFTKKKTIEWAGTAIMALVVLRLLFVEMWAMPIAGRIVTFVVIGLFLVSTAFIRKKNPSNA